MKKIIMVVVLFALILGCTVPQEAPREPDLQFQLQLGGNQEGQTMIRAGVKNTGDATYPENSSFEATGELRDGTGALRSRFAMYHLRELEPGEEFYPMAYYVNLTPGAYNLTWGNPEYGYARAQFTIVEQNGHKTLGEQVIQPSDQAS